MATAGSMKTNGKRPATLPSSWLPPNSWPWQRQAIDHVLLGKPPRGLPFLIAEGQTGTQLAGRYGWLSAVLLVLGMAAAGAAVLLFCKFIRLV